MAISANSTTNPLPTGFGSNVGIVSGPVLPANPTRGGIVFYNPSLSVIIAVCPAVVNLVVNGVPTGNATGVAVINGSGSITINPGDKFIIDNLSATGAFNAIASGPGGLLTTWEF